LSNAPLLKRRTGGKQDPRLYEYLALVDAIRLGNSREAHIAEQLLKESLQP